MSFQYAHEPVLLLYICYFRGKANQNYFIIMRGGGALIHVEFQN